MSGREHHRVRRIFAMPALIGMVTLIGLAAALFGDGWNDALAWIGLGVPVVTALHFAFRRVRKGS